MTIKIIPRVEEWKSMIFEFNNTLVISKKYLASSFGKIKNGRTGRILEPHIKHGTKYLQITFQEDGFPDITRSIHRLIALTFIPNPTHLPQVNHADLDESNNYSYNLEWMNNEDNTVYSMKKKDKLLYTIDELEKILSMIQIPGWTYYSIMKELGYTKESNPDKHKILNRIVTKKGYYGIYKDNIVIAIKGQEPRIEKQFRLTNRIINIICYRMTKPDWTYDGILKMLNVPNNERRNVRIRLSDIYNRYAYTDISCNFIFQKPFIDKRILTSSDVRGICKSIRDGDRTKIITNKFNCDRRTIDRIRNKTAYKEVSDQYF